MPNKNTSNSKKTQKTSTNAGTPHSAGQSGNTGSTMPQNASAQQTGHNLQQGHGHAQAHVATGGQWGQFSATQHVQGGGFGGTAVQVQSGASAQGQHAQYPQNIKWRNTLIPSNYQGTTGQGGSSSTSESGSGAGAGVYGAGFRTDPFRTHRGRGVPPSRGTRGAKPSRGQQG